MKPTLIEIKLLKSSEKDYSESSLGTSLNCSLDSARKNNHSNLKKQNTFLQVRRNTSKGEDKIKFRRSFRCNSLVKQRNKSSFNLLRISSMKSHEKIKTTNEKEDQLSSNKAPSSPGKKTTKGKRITPMKKILSPLLTPIKNNSMLNAPMRASFDLTSVKKAKKIVYQRQLMRTTKKSLV